MAVGVFNSLNIKFWLSTINCGRIMSHQCYIDQKNICWSTLKTSYRSLATRRCYWFFFKTTLLLIMYNWVLRDIIESVFSSRFFRLLRNRIIHAKVFFKISSRLVSSRLASQVRNSPDVTEDDVFYLRYFSFKAFFSSRFLFLQGLFFFEKLSFLFQ